MLQVASILAALGSPKATSATCLYTCDPHIWQEIGMYQTGLIDIQIGADPIFLNLAHCI